MTEISPSDLKNIVAGGREVFLEKSSGHVGILLHAWSSAVFRNGSWLVPCARLDGDKVVVQDIKISDNGPMAQKLRAEKIFRLSH